LSDGLVTQHSANLFDLTGRLLPKGQPVALVDFPRSANCGDHAIWLGEKALLSALGVSVAYECDAYSYDQAAMASRIGSGVILMHGGGNFGDLYTLYNEFRLRVMEDFPQNKVIVLPQQVTFLSNGYLNRTKALIGNHKDVTLIARGAIAHEFLQQHFGQGAQVLLAPDMAFALGAQDRPCAPAYDVVWIARTDGERAHNNEAELAMGLSDAPVGVLDLKGFADGLSIGYKMKHRPGEVLITDWYNIDWTPNTRRACDQLDFDSQSRIYLSRALSLLSLGRIVVTDRLHGHILCLLLGIPHILLNNNTGKNWNFYDTWTRSSPLGRLAQRPAEAWDLAQAAIKDPTAQSLGLTGWSDEAPSMSFGDASPNWKLPELRVAMSA
jgi:exopolysaccharide biosynthesis predicted pyruvyltransferase EpsI